MRDNERIVSPRSPVILKGVPCSGGSGLGDEGAVVSRDDFGALAEPHRRELQLHCYRMLGSLQDAEDLVQETLLRAWKKLDTLTRKGSFRAWLYRIATNACLDELDRRLPRTLPQARGPDSGETVPPLEPILEPIWLEPYPDELVAGLETSPEARYDLLESTTLAFLRVLHVLTPRQRAILILRDVLDWRADEVSQALEITVSAVTSALHRARKALAKHYSARDRHSSRVEPDSEATRSLLDQYVRAWEYADVDALISLLKRDATFAMPPSPSWYRVRSAIRAVVSAVVLAGKAEGRWKMKSTRANSLPALAWYQQDETTSTYRAFGIQVLTIEDNLLSDITTFFNPALVRLFGFPEELG